MRTSDLNSEILDFIKIKSKVQSHFLENPHKILKSKQISYIVRCRNLRVKLFFFTKKISLEYCKLCLSDSNY